MPSGQATSAESSAVTQDYSEGLLSFPALCYQFQTSFQYQVLLDGSVSLRDQAEGQCVRAWLEF